MDLMDSQRSKWIYNGFEWIPRAESFPACWPASTGHWGGHLDLFGLLCGAASPSSSGA